MGRKGVHLKQYNISNELKVKIRGELIYWDVVLPLFQSVQFIPFDFGFSLYCQLWSIPMHTNQIETLFTYSNKLLVKSHSLIILLVYVKSQQEQILWDRKSGVELCKSSRSS